MKTLIAIDCSMYASNILAALARKVWDKDSQLHLITVVERSASCETHEQSMHQSQLIMDDRLEYLRSRLPHCRITGEIVEGSASDIINEVAREWHADSIIIGSHGDTGVRRSHIGSVAAAVVNEAPCSIEVIKLISKKQSGTKPHESSNHSRTGTAHR